MNQDPWECRACYLIADLDIHGRCSRCGSDSVIPQAAILLAEYGMEIPESREAR